MLIDVYFHALISLEITLIVTIYFVYLIWYMYTESSCCNKIEAVTYHYHCTPYGGFFLYKYKRYICRWHKGAFKINYLYSFLCILNFLLTYSSLKILTAVLGKIFMLINIDLIPELSSECGITPGRTKNLA